MRCSWKSTVAVLVVSFVLIGMSASLAERRKPAPSPRYAAKTAMSDPASGWSALSEEARLTLVLGYRVEKIRLGESDPESGLTPAKYWNLFIKVHIQMRF